MAPDLFVSSNDCLPIPTYVRSSPLVLADRMITLAQDADRAGYRDTASGLLRLVFSLLDHGAPAQA